MASNPARIAHGNYNHAQEVILDGEVRVFEKMNGETGTEQFVLETISARKEGPVLFAEILAPPMNLLGPELVRDLVSLIQQGEALKPAVDKSRVKDLASRPIKFDRR